MHQIEEIIGQESFTAIKAQFFHDIADKIITTEPVTPNILTTAVELIKETYITPVDSIQLGTMIVLKQRIDNIIFLCSDRKLLRLAGQKGLTVEKI